MCFLVLIDLISSLSLEFFEVKRDVVRCRRPQASSDVKWCAGPGVDTVVRNEKAEAFGSAHKTRVGQEVTAWLQAEIRKAEARAATAEGYLSGLC